MSVWEDGSWATVVWYALENPNVLGAPHVVCAYPYPYPWLFPYTNTHAPTCNPCPHRAQPRRRGGGALQRLTRTPEEHLIVGGACPLPSQGRYANILVCQCCLVSCGWQRES